MQAESPRKTPAQQPYCVPSEELSPVVNLGLFAVDASSSFPANDQDRRSTPSFRDSSTASSSVLHATAGVNQTCSNDAVFLKLATLQKRVEDADEELARTEEVMSRLVSENAAAHESFVQSSTHLRTAIREARAAQKQQTEICIAEEEGDQLRQQLETMRRDRLAKSSVREDSSECVARVGTAMGTQARALQGEARAMRQACTDVESRSSDLQGFLGSIAERQGRSGEEVVLMQHALIELQHLHATLGHRYVDLERSKDSRSWDRGSSTLNRRHEATRRRVAERLRQELRDVSEEEQCAEDAELRLLTQARDNDVVLGRLHMELAAHDREFGAGVGVEGRWSASRTR